MPKRIQFIVDDKVYKALEELREKTNAKSLVEVFRDALKAYEWMVNELSEGREIVSKPIEEKERHYTGVITSKNA
ncbi:MAG: ribbon-helix-helix protein, CopG family [Nitrososphaerales archaeon]|jgi:uncharacterized protein YutD